MKSKICVTLMLFSCIMSFAKARKRVETLFSQMVDQFMLCRNYAKQ